MQQMPPRRSNRLNERFEEAAREEAIALPPHGRGRRAALRGRGRGRDTHGCGRGDGGHGRAAGGYGRAGGHGRGREHTPDGNEDEVEELVEDELLLAAPNFVEVMARQTQLIQHLVTTTTGR
ncbi:hypothetical protein PR202_ga17100 [Eleusine coracana subsp. coracana]|uniref:Uncharacterized protein n=1 Tax=Eleusine coracana subsp. coracana TaxID=191504 RepID=A0AAV5CPA2_ELECO|nr:hypothetical protein PR202_ga17100 [Eleusine coracana subsp. coracana]